MTLFRAADQPILPDQMKRLLLFIVLLFAGRLASAQCSSCTYSVNNSNYNQNTAYMNGNSTLCITGTMSINNMNFNGSNNVICVPAGVTFTAGFNPSNVTFNVYGTVTFNGSFNSNVTVNVYNGGAFNGGNNAGLNSTATVNISSGGTLKIKTMAGGTVNVASGATFEVFGDGSAMTGGTVNNNGTFKLTSTGQVSVQGVTVNNNANAQMIATAPSKVTFNHGTFYNYGSASFKYVENNEGSFNNKPGGSLTFDQGTFQHGALYNEGTMTVNCSGYSGNCNSGNACMTLGNKNAGQFSNTGTLSINGSLCLGAGVIFHNNGNVNVGGNLTVDGGGQWTQGSNGQTNVTGTTTTQNGGQFTGGSYCSNGTSGTINSTQSCGSPPTIPDTSVSTCKGVFVNIPVRATAASGTSIVWSSLRLRNGSDSATSASPTLTVTAKGSFLMTYTGSSANIKFTPVAGFTGTLTINYKIAALSGSTTTYSAEKNITVTVVSPPNKPSASITLP